MKYKLQVSISKTALDLSRRIEDTFKELPPYAIDDKGKCINPSKYSKLIPGDPLNIYDKIQSYAESVDFYKMLEQVGNGVVYVKNPPTQLQGDFSSVPADKLSALKTLVDNLYLQKFVNQKQEKINEVVTNTEEKKENEV